MIATLLTLYRWTFQRLPMRFSIPLWIFLLLFFTLVFPVLAYYVVPGVTGLAAKQSFEGIPASWFGLSLLSALITTLSAIAGALLCYILAVLFYRIARQPAGQAISYAPQLPSTPAATVSFPALQDRRIGIILAGGGAKGAYQAGSLQAANVGLPVPAMGGIPPSRCRRRRRRCVRRDPGRACR